MDSKEILKALKNKKFQWALAGVLFFGLISVLEKKFIFWEKNL